MLLVPLILCQLFAIEQSYGSPVNEWRTKSVYQLLTDRFNNPTPRECDVFDLNYCGGTFKGITTRHIPILIPFLITRHSRQTQLY